MPRTLFRRKSYLQGYYQQGDECSPCTNGTFSASIGSTSCTICPVGYLSGTGSSKCSFCDGGYYLESGEYLMCPAGTYSYSNATSCASCTNGTFSTSGSTSCSENCPSGFEKNGTQCLSPPQTSSSASNSISGSDSGLSSFFSSTGFYVIIGVIALCVLAIIFFLARIYLKQKQGKQDLQLTLNDTHQILTAEKTATNARVRTDIL